MHLLQLKKSASKDTVRCSNSKYSLKYNIFENWNLVIFERHITLFETEWFVECSKLLTFSPYHIEIHVETSKSIKSFLKIEKKRGFISNEVRFCMLLYAHSLVLFLKKISITATKWLPSMNQVFVPQNLYWWKKMCYKWLFFIAFAMDFFHVYL